MIRCHLSTLMGTRKMKIIDVARETGLNRSTVRALYYEDWVRVERDSIEKICRLFNCKLQALFEWTPDETPAAEGQLAEK